MDTIRARHPSFRRAVSEDAKCVARFRGERSDFSSRGDLLRQVIRLCWVSDGFLGQLLYRLKAASQKRGVPIIPQLAQRGAMMVAQISIGDPVVIAPGIYIIHGQVVIDGLTEIHSGVTIAPWTSIGLRAGNITGPTIHERAQIGTGSSILGPLEIGASAIVGANSVVTHDVAPGTTVVGSPARPISTGP